MKKFVFNLSSRVQKKGYLFALAILALLVLSYRLASLCVSYYAQDDYFIHTVNSTSSQASELTLSFTEAQSYAVEAVTIPYTLDAGEYQLQISYESTQDYYLYIATTNEYDLAADGFPSFGGTWLLAENTTQTIAFTLEQTHYLVTAYLIYTGEGSLAITETTLESLTPISTDRYARPVFYAVLLLLFVAALALTYRRGAPAQRKARCLVVLCVAAIALVSSYPLLQMNEIVFGHDVSFHINRIAGLYQELVSGHFPARLTSVFNSGYGYLNSALYPELFLYLSAVLMFGGVSAEFAQNVLIILMNMLCPLLTYYSFYKISKHRPLALAGTALYALSVYRMSNLYVRAALGEFFFLGFLPFMLYAVYHLLLENGKRWWLLALAATCILQSHVLGTVFTAFLFGVFLLVLFALRSYNRQPLLPPFLQLVKAGVLTVLLNLWFLVPFLYYVGTGTLALFDAEYEFTTHFMPNLVAVGDIFTFSMQESGTGVQLSLGAFLFAVFLCCAVGSVALYVLGYRATKNTRTKRMAQIEGAILRQSGILHVRPQIEVVQAQANHLLVWCCFGLIAFFTLLISNEALWLFLANIAIFQTIAANIQYSFRLIGLIVFCICTIFVLLVMRLPNGKSKTALGCAVFAIAFVLGAYRLTTDYILTAQDVYNTIFLDSPPEYLLADTDYAQETLETQKVQLSSDDVILTAYQKENCVITFSYENTSDETQDIRLPLFYYDGYRATLSTGENLPVTAGVNNVLHVILPPNSSGTICVEYYDNRYFRVANWISLITLAACLLWCYYGRSKFASKRFLRRRKMHLLSNKNR